MGRLTEEQIEEFKAQEEGRAKVPVERPTGRAPVESRDRTPGRGLPSMKWWGVPKPPPPDELPGLGESLRRAERLAGLGLGSVMADHSKYPEAFRAFRDEVSRGDWDAAIEAYQDVFDMPKGYWGTSEAIAPVILTGGLAGVGKGLMSAAPKLSQTLGQVSGRAMPGVETALRGIGKGLRLPWEAEEAVGRVAMKGLAYPFSQLGKGAQFVKRRLGREAGTETTERVDDLTRKTEPPQEPTRAEAESGPDGINLDPMEGFEQTPQLGWWSGKVQAINDMTEGLLGKEFFAKRRTDVEGVIETAKRARASIVARAESLANTARTFTRKGIRDNFRIDPKTGHILDRALQNRVRMSFNNAEVTLQSPTIQDIAARYDTYEPFLTEGQKEFMGVLRNIVEDGTSWKVGGTKFSMPGWNHVFRKNMDIDPKRMRPDITGNGFYITRGSVKRGKETATDILDELDKMVSLGKKRARGDIAAEKKAFFPAMGKVVDANGKVIMNADVKGRAITYNSLEQTIEDYIKGVADRVTGRRVEKKVKDLVKEYKGGATVKPGLIAGVDEADDALAAAINREFRTPIGRKLANAPVIRSVNNLYRGIKANFDLSAIGIHGSLAMFRSPVQWGQATSLVFKSLAATMKGAQPGVRAMGQEIIDEGIAKIDIDAVANGRIVSEMWATYGLRVGGTSVETQLPGVGRLLGQAGEGFRGRIAAGVGEAFQLSNRLFGSFGDVLRLRWADELLRHELAKGKTLENLARRGDDGISELDRIAKAANRLTGWSDQRFGGDIGEVTMFAARFFQARVETLGHALVGVSRLRVPTVESLKTLGRTRANVPFRGRPMIESDVLTSIGRDQSIESREALHTMVRMIGMGVTATEMANAMLGNETDRRPIVDGKINSNFYTIRMGGRDFSLFGPTIGLLRAIGTLAVGVREEWYRPDKAMADATKGLGGGVVRLIWDNLTGYGFRGDPAPIGVFREDPEIGKVSDVMDILRYVGELAIPISPGAVGGELFEGAKSAKEGDWERVAGAGLATVAEAVGARVAPLSRKDEAEELSQEKYGVPYESLTYQVQDEIDELVTERMGEYAFGGQKGYLRKKRKETDDKLIESTETISNKWLSGSPASETYHPVLARDELNKAKHDHRVDVYGKEWNEEKQRTIGGILELLYDRDEEKEEPEKGTREYRIWQYGQTFVDATDRGTGELDFDKLNKLQGRFWASLTYRLDPTTNRRVNEVDEMLESIRLIEGNFDPRMQNLLDAGRYATNLKLNLGGEIVSYYDLEDHKMVEDYIVSRTDASRWEIREYLDKSYEERKAFQKSKQGESIGKALSAASGNNGILGRLRKEFVRRAPAEWSLAMFEAGYKYQGKGDFEDAMFKRIRAGEPYRRLNYKRLHRSTLMGR